MRSRDPHLERWNNTPLPMLEGAACEGLDTDIFFLEKHNATQLARVKSICKECPVRVECLQFAIKWHIPHGVWGGTGPKERTMLRKLTNVG